MPRPIRKRSAAVQSAKPANKVTKEPSHSSTRLGKRLLANARNVSTIIEEPSKLEDLNDENDKENERPKSPKSPVKSPAKVDNMSAPPSPSPLRTRLPKHNKQYSPLKSDDDPFGISKITNPGKKLRSPTKDAKKIESIMDQIPIFSDESAGVDEDDGDHNDEEWKYKTPAEQPTTPSRSAMVSPRKPLRPLTTEELLERMPKTSTRHAETVDESSEPEPDDDDDLDYGAKPKAKTTRKGKGKAKAKGKQKKPTSPSPLSSPEKPSPSFIERISQAQRKNQSDDFVLEEEVAYSSSP